jgi:hypothetical protein
MKGDFSILNFLAAIVLFGALIFFGSMILTSSREKQAELTSIKIVSIEGKDVLNLMYGINYPVPIEEDEELLTLLRYGCVYGAGEQKTYFLSDSIPIILELKPFLEKYLTDKLIKNFNLTVHCGNKTLSIGFDPKGVKNIQSSPITFPVPNGGRGEGVLLRW